MLVLHMLIDVHRPVVALLMFRQRGRAIAKAVVPTTRLSELVIFSGVTELLSEVTVVRSAGGTVRLAETGQTCFVAEAMPEVLQEVQPRLGAAFQALQNRSVFRGDLAALGAVKLTACAIQEQQVRLQCHRQTAFIVRPTTGGFLAYFLTRRLQRDLSQPARLLETLRLRVLHIRSDDIRRGLPVHNPGLDTRKVALFQSVRDSAAFLHDDRGPHVPAFHPECGLPQPIAVSRFIPANF